MLNHKKYLPDFIFGSIDGLVTTFAVVSGVIGAALSAKIILILGFANLFADGFSMAISNYLSTKSAVDLNQDVSNRRASVAALATFIAFVIIGLVPLLPYVIDFGNINFLLSIILTMVAFAVVGWVKGALTGTNRLIAALETLLVGALAAVIAYVVGNFLAGLV